MPPILLKNQSVKGYMTEIYVLAVIVFVFCMQQVTDPDMVVNIFQLRNILQQILGESSEIERDSHGMVQLNGTQSYFTFTHRDLNKKATDDICKCNLVNAKICIQYRISLEFTKCNSQKLSIGSSNGLAPNKRQAITWINDD